MHVMGRRSTVQSDSNCRAAKAPSASHHHQRTVWQPALRLEYYLTRPIGKSFRPASPLFPVPFGGSQHGQKRQCPHTLGPRNLSQEHEAEPAQPTGFDEMRIRRAHRIAIDAARFDLASPTPLDRVIQAQHQWPLRDKGGYQHAHQYQTSLTAIPRSAVQNSMIILKPPLLPQSHHTQRAAHGSLSWSQNGSDQ
jgi:hypothetical protein